MANVNFQKINEKYLVKLQTFFKEYTLSDYSVVYKNEEIFTNRFGLKTFKFTNSGTSALYLIFKYIIDNKIQHPKVIGPAWCHVSWINICNWLSLEYDFVDIRKETLCMDPYLLEEKLKNDHFDIIILADMAGYIGEDSFIIRELSDKYNCILIEDAANALGQKYKNINAGCIGDFSFFSFSNPKIITAGEGGAIVSSKFKLNDLFESYIYQGSWYKSGRTKLESGLNFIMSNYLTQLLTYQLDDLKEIQKSKHDLYLEHKNRWKDKLFDFPSDNEFYSPSFYLVQLTKDIVKLVLKQNIYDYKLYKDMGFLKSEIFTIAKEIEDYSIYLKNF